MRRKNANANFPGTKSLLAGAMTLLCACAALAQSGTAAAAGTRMEVTDEAGRRVSVPQPVNRIVSLAPNLTEMVYALGAQERLAGVTDFCDYPEEAKQKPRVGGAVNPSLEQIVAMKPDLVLATKALNRRETVEALEDLGIAVYATAPRTVTDVVEAVRRVGEIVGERAQGEILAANMRARLDELKQRLAGRLPKRVLFIVWADPLQTIGKQTFLADALRWAGAETVVDVEQPWPRISLEEVVRLQPNYLVFASSHSETMETTVSDLAERPGWRGLEAIRLRRVAVISDAVNRPAPRLVDAIEQLARQLHPGAFANERLERIR